MCTEQIRSILIEVQGIIIEICEGLTEDMVTVDFVYCYPDKKYSGQLPYVHSQGEKYAWRLITAGDHSCGGSMKTYLENKHSFFSCVDDCGYVFFNDKLEASRGRHYVTSRKDEKYGQEGVVGSVVGMEIELRNDAPEATFVKGILTITTYGRKLYQGESIKQTEFEEIFKEDILNTFGSLILSEVSQMYIRHTIRDGYMCPRTGRFLEDEDKAGKGTEKCSWMGIPCGFDKEHCK